MAKHFCGGTLAAFARSATTILETTTAGRFDGTYSTLAILIASGENISTPTLAITGTFWSRHTYYDLGGTASAGARLQYNNGATGVFRILGIVSTNNYQCQYWNGSAWTNTGAVFTLATTTLAVMAVKVILNSGFELYINGTLITSGTGWTGSGTTVTLISLASNKFSGIAVSEIMVADYDIRDSHYKPSVLNGNSATNTGGSGAYTDVQEASIDDTTAVIVATSTNKMGQTHAALTVPAGFIIAAVVIAGRVRASGSITDAKFGIRSGGTNYSSGALSATAGYEPRVYIRDDDPATSTQFTQTGFNNAEIYEEAA